MTQGKFKLKQIDKQIQPSFKDMMYVIVDIIFHTHILDRNDILHGADRESMDRGSDRESFTSTYWKTMDGMGWDGMGWGG